MKRQEGNVAPFTNEAKPALFFYSTALTKVLTEGPTVSKKSRRRFERSRPTKIEASSVDSALK